MLIYLYRNNSEPNRLDKDLTEVRVVSGSVRDTVSILNPAIRIERKADEVMDDFNYFYIPAWNRYYFLQDVVTVRREITEITGRVDVLQSFKNDIENLTVITDKQTESGSVYINDGSWVAESREFYSTLNFQNGFNNAGEFILITAGA